MKRAGLMLLLLALWPVTLHGQSGCQANPASCSTAANTLLINLTVGRAFQLSIAPTSTALSPPMPADYDAGFAASNGPTATIRSNGTWQLTISAGAATWTAAAPARLNKPAEDLLWATSASAPDPWRALSTTAEQVTFGGATASTQTTLFYRTRYAWNLDTPGDYSLQIVFTITAP